MQEMKNMAYWKRKNALPGINHESEGNTDTPNGRSKSSAFQMGWPGMKKKGEGEEGGEKKSGGVGGMLVKGARNVGKGIKGALGL